MLYYRKREEIFRQAEFEKKKQHEGIKLAENFNDMGKSLDLKERLEQDVVLNI